MGKLMDRLQKQLETEHKQDAEDCIKIYNHLKETNDGTIWESQWNPITEVTFKGFPSDVRYYKLNSIGKLILKGLESK
jgi:hypothetical protein